MNKYLIFLFLITIWSCESTHRINKDNAYAIFIEKENFQIPQDSLESPIYQFSFSLLIKKGGLTNISLKTLDYNSKFLFSKKIDFNSDINSLKKIVQKKTAAPFYIIENENNQYKYFFNFRKFKNPLNLRIHNHTNQVIAPIRSIEFINRISSILDENITLKNNELNYLDTINIYQYDLKINLTDQKVRLHYITNGHIISSNWIDISEKTERLDKLFEY